MIFNRSQLQQCHSQRSSSISEAHSLFGKIFVRYVSFLPTYILRTYNLQRMCMNSSMNIHTPCTEIRPVFIFSTFLSLSLFWITRPWSLSRSHIIICLLRSETGSNPKPHSVLLTCLFSLLYLLREQKPSFSLKLFMTLIFFIFLTLDPVSS